MLLENLSYPEVETYLETKDRVLIPIGSTEQHSPYGLIGTDFIAAQTIAREVGETLDLMVAPTLCYGVSPHHMAFKGTVSLSPQTLMALIMDVVRSLLAHGFKHIVFINGHGGNTDTIQAALMQLKVEDLAGRFEVICWYELDEVKALVEANFGGEEGSHATPGEVAITRYVRPDHFASKATAAGRVEQPDHHWPLTAEEMRAFFPDGRMASAPWLATAAIGAKLVGAAVAAITGRLQEDCAVSGQATSAASGEPAGLGPKK